MKFRALLTKVARDNRSTSGGSVTHRIVLADGTKFTCERTNNGKVRCVQHASSYLVDAFADLAGGGFIVGKSIAVPTPSEAIASYWQHIGDNMRIASRKVQSVKSGKASKSGRIIRSRASA